MSDIAHVPPGLLICPTVSKRFLRSRSSPARRSHQVCATPISSWFRTGSSKIVSPRVAATDVVLVVEIVSPGSRGTDHAMKLHEYAAAGIAHYWIVDPEAPVDDRFLAYRLDGDIYRRVTALDAGRVRVTEPVTMDFLFEDLTGRG
ncbi:Uma2 family endonuclease [Mycolicibacterium sp. S3B2]|uniref:Uma2 family endonuclease n=1 Tax=Mycolicibacterium sp. S3B2 TaxID=3415120 RepID=UPI003C7C3A16